MTQKFHENETATIALYKYHDLLKCEEDLYSLLALVNIDDWKTARIQIENLQGVFSRIVRGRMPCTDFRISYDE